DQEWVDSWLLPRLYAANLRICTENDFELGVPRVVNIERFITSSQHTLLILSPNWVASEWDGFESLLSQSRNPAGLIHRTIPLLLQPCELPRRLDFLTRADFTRAEQRESQLARVIAAIRVGPPEPVHAPAPPRSEL